MVKISFFLTWKFGFPVLIMLHLMLHLILLHLMIHLILLHLIMLNTFFHLRRSITRKYVLITNTKESLIFWGYPVFSKIMGNPLNLSCRGISCFFYPFPRFLGRIPIYVF